MPLSINCQNYSLIMHPEHDFDSLLSEKTAKEIKDMKPQWKLLFYSDDSMSFWMNLFMSGHTY